MTPPMTPASLLSNYLSLPLIWIWFFNQVLEPKYKNKMVPALEVLVFSALQLVPLLFLDKLLLRTAYGMLEPAVIIFVFFVGSIAHRIYICSIWLQAVALCEISMVILAVAVFNEPFMTVIASGRYDLQIFFLQLYPS